MKKLFIIALFAILMGGFTLTANAQDKTKIGSQQNEQSIKTGEYDAMVLAFQDAVNNFVNAYKNGKTQDVTEKNKPVDLEGLLATAEKARETVEPYYEKLSKSQKETFDKANKELDKTKNKFYQK